MSLFSPNIGPIPRQFLSNLLCEADCRLKLVWKKGLLLGL